MAKAKSSQMKSRRKQQIADEEEGRLSKNSPTSFEGVTSSSAASTIIKATNIEGMVKKKKKGRSVLMKKTHNSRLLKLKKAKKSLKRLELELAKKRGYTICLKQQLMEEATAIQEMQAKLALMKLKNEIIFVKKECMEQFVASMLAIFEAEDALV